MRQSVDISQSSSTALPARLRYGIFAVRVASTGVLAKAFSWDGHVFKDATDNMDGRLAAAKGNSLSLFYPGERVSAQQLRTVSTILPCHTRAVRRASVQDPPSP